MIGEVRSADLTAKGSNSNVAASMVTTTEERNVDEEIAKTATFRSAFNLHAVRSTTVQAG